MTGTDRTDGPDATERTDLADTPTGPPFAAGFPSAGWLADLHARGSDPAFADARSALDDRVDGYHRLRPDLPNRQAGYYHEFFCPEHAVQLVFNPRDGHRHACPVDGHIFSGEPFDSAWGWSVNDALSDAALRASVRRALAHAPARAAADAGLIREVLIGYADRDRTMPPAPQGHPSSYSGMTCWSALDESVWIIRLVWAAALARDAFEARELAHLREGLFAPALAQLHGVRYRQIQNVGNWDRGAILALGLLLGDDATVQEAIEERYGIRDQLTRGVTAEGLWWELSLSYHFYVLGAVAWTMRAFRASGRPFDREDTVRAMFQAPIDLAFPDTTLPATNDCWYRIGLTGEVGHGIPNAEGFYEMAYGWFRDPTFAWVVRANGLAAAGRPRATLEGLLDGAADLPVVKRGETPARHLEDSGVAMLRAGAGPEATAVLLKASRDDGDSHGHPDQLGIALFAAGARVAIDPGTPGYGIGLNDTWYRQSAAHSTVLLDSRSQPPGRAEITRWEATDERVTAEAEITWPAATEWPDVVRRAMDVSWPDRDPSAGYAGVHVRRRLELRPGDLVDTVTVEAPDECAIDLVLHLPAGTATHLTSAANAAPSGLLFAGCGYEHLTDVSVVSDTATLSADLPHGHVIVDLAEDPNADDTCILASAPGNPAADRHAVLIRRRRARKTTFVTRIRVQSAGARSRPDGHPWEVAWNLDFPIDTEGRITIP